MDRHPNLLLGLAARLEAAAATLRRVGERAEKPLSEEPDRGSSVESHAPPGVDPDDAVGIARGLHQKLGSHQEMVIRQLARAHPRGLSVSEINPSPGTQPNTYLTLDKLAELHLVKRDDSTYPRRYFLGARLLEGCGDAGRGDHHFGEDGSS